MVGGGRLRLPSVHQSRTPFEMFPGDHASHAVLSRAFSWDGEGEYPALPVEVIAL